MVRLLAGKMPSFPGRIYSHAYLKKGDEILGGKVVGKIVVAKWIFEC